MGKFWVHGILPSGGADSKVKGGETKAPAKLQDGVYEDENGKTMRYGSSSDNKMRRAIEATQAKTKEVSINRENRSQNAEESNTLRSDPESLSGGIATVPSPSRGTAELCGNDGETTEIGVVDEDLLTEDDGTMVGVHVSCFHEFEGSPCCWPDEPESLRRALQEQAREAPPLEVEMGGFAYWQWDRWFFVGRQGLTFKDTGNSRLLSNAISMSRETISQTVNHQLLNRASQVTGSEAHACMMRTERSIVREKVVPLDIQQTYTVEEAAGSSEGLVRTRTIIVTPPKEALAEVRSDIMLNTAEIFLSLKMRLDARILIV